MADELYDFYFSPNTVRVITSRRMRWMGEVVHMGKMRTTYKISVKNIKV
jgi:hypothetical protein